MLSHLEVDNIDQLIHETVPSTITLDKEMDIAPAISEMAYLQKIKAIAAKNEVYKSYLGDGFYNSFVPPVIQRNILENPGWYTQYTPYQSEIAQGRLEALLNFQTMVADLTGMELANASLLDEATAAAEAMLLMRQVKNKKNKEANVICVSENCFRTTIDVLQTRAEPLGIELQIAAPDAFDLHDKVFGVMLQYPDKHGAIEDFTTLSANCAEQKIMVSVASDLLALCNIKAPGEWGADIVVGNTQRFGVPMGFGGPHAAYFATKDAYKRLIPGRIIGVSVDQNEKPALRMALQTREQHIRREKATSNICTAQALLAIMAGMYAVYHGPDGLKQIANRVHYLSCILENKIQPLGFKQVNPTFFDTLCFDLSEKSETEINQLKLKCNREKINLKFTSKHCIIALDETTTYEDVCQLEEIFAEVSGKVFIPSNLNGQYKDLPSRLNEAVLRDTDFLSHPIFNSHHSETKMLRYIKLLEGRDLSLAHSMIPLGSCTMKLNATSELMPVSFEAFNSIHPFVPLAQVEGYLEILDELEKDLCAVTGFQACSLQPNSGAQGEYTGLMVIRKYHQANGDDHRNIVLIPSSAHGTNPASAILAGMKVVVVKCDKHGNVDTRDLIDKCEQHKNDLAALMVTYPSTHGVFEESIMEICSVVHQHGGQVYMDGANMNAQVGLTNPHTIGADVCHLNLHKTFAIPHGGGGPGMGPICVAEHLAPHLPNHLRLPSYLDENRIGAVASAPWGSASILLISYAYIKLLGPKGLTDSSKYAILNANYIKERLADYYPILYSGKKFGRVAHELIVDMRDYKESCDVTVEDVAKRLMDYGFHAPTVSFPVPGTIMIEPTESESKDELDRFCDAMIAINEEIREIAEGKYDKENNVLKNAPHTMEEVSADEWNYPYSREKAAFPQAFVRERKFWAPVKRINNSYGDRNLFCSCPPISSFEEVEA